jgi:uncharacterized protein YegP (UPF0339 family)
MSQKEQIRINLHDGKYRFSIYPAAFLKNQEIGHSSECYNSVEECSSAIGTYASFVRSKFRDEQYIKYEKGNEQNHNMFGFYFVDDSGARFFESGFKYSRKQNCKNGINGVIRAFSEFS